MRRATWIVFATAVFLSLLSAGLVAAQPMPNGWMKQTFQSEPSLEQRAQNRQPSASQQMAIDEENEQMFNDMRRVAQWMDQYCLWNKRFPEFGDEMINAEQQLNQLSPNNPYKTNELVLGRGLDAQPQFGNFDTSSNNFNDADVYSMQYAVPDDDNANLNRIKLTIDNSLSEIEAQQWLTQPPDDWQAPPGTISLIGNQQNMYVLWGAGRDGRPLRDPLSHRVQLIIGRFAMLNNQE